ncbi:hypothetical protein SAMD00023353_6300470 [Rosellinia necatrix]|uniref:Uncharacterized protein n=1 Tax=Rosellinia necatrix TaxID=77044 RepID=A0A1S8AAR2_ROSNE|nr:hypothetical protein SAMD00023353_6300470 [Rosellinia necatrix]
MTHDVVGNRAKSLVPDIEPQGGGGNPEWIFKITEIVFQGIQGIQGALRVMLRQSIRCRCGEPPRAAKAQGETLG